MKRVEKEAFVETSELKPNQQRLLKTVQMMMGHMMTTDNESEYFESAAELMKLLNQSFRQANFANENKSHIAYAEQVLEYALDTFSESTDSKATNFDN